MNNKLDEDYLKLLNTSLQQTLSDYEGVNYISFLTASKGNKCSLVMEPVKKLRSIGLMNEKFIINEADDDFYYGLHPEVSSIQIIKGIASGFFQNETKITEFMNEISLHHPVFKLHADQERYLMALFSATLVKMSNNFGICFACDNYDDMKQKLGNSFTIQELYVKFNDNEKSIIFLSGLSDYVIEILTELQLGYKFTNNKLYLVKHGKNLRELYNDAGKLEKHIKLAKGSIYYSGVMPRTVEIEFKNDIYNAHVDTYKFHVERTTFATLDLFDNCDIIQHFLLQNHQSLLEEVFTQEDNAQNLLVNDYERQQELLDNINTYLSMSPNTHTIAVTGNIETCEKLLVLCERDKNSIDSSIYYPSANGQSEFKDINPDIYKNSVYEDYPTLDFSDDYRLDFEGEINREAFAELNIRLLDDSWQYYGFSFLLIKSENNPFQKRRMHFNVLAKNYTKENLADVIEARNYATEKFENSKIVGLSIIQRTFIAEYFVRFFKLLFSHIEDVVTIMIGLILANSLLQNFDEISLSNIDTFFVENLLPIFIAIVISFVFCKKILQVALYFKNIRAHLRTIYHSKFNINDMNSLREFIMSLQRNNQKLKLHGVTLLTTCLYFIYQDE